MSEDSPPDVARRASSHQVPRFDPRLYLILDPSQVRGRSVTDVARRAVLGGVTLVQLRCKDAEAREFADLARRLVAVLGPLRVPLIVNDRVDVALAAGAQGAHVGQQDLDVRDVRSMLGPGAIIGLSATNADEARAVPQAGVDYVGLGPVLATDTKLDAAPPLGVRGFAIARALFKLPAVAIGGLTPANSGAYLDAGADGLAVSSAICGADDPTLAAQEFRRVLLEWERSADIDAPSAGSDRREQPSDPRPPGQPSPRHFVDDRG